MELSELAELVADHPDAVDPYLVYADHLQETGDPRGELISLDLMRLEDPLDPERVRAVARHLDRHRHELLGPLVALSQCLSNDTWHLGFLKRATLLHPENEPPAGVARWIEWLFDAPASRFLRELTVTPLLAGDYTPVIQSIARRGGRALRRLRVGPSVHAVRLEMIGTSRMFARLESLALAAGRIKLGTLALPELTELDLWVDTFTADHLRDIATADLPALRSLAIAFHHSRAELPRLLLAPMPKLEHLRVDARESMELAEFVAELTRSDVARHLTTLTIDGLSLADVERLSDSAGVFEALHRLVIGTRALIADRLDPFRDRGVEVTARRSLGPFDPWDEQTEIGPSPHDTEDLTHSP